MQAHMLPARHQAPNVTVHFPFEDGCAKDPFFLDTARAILFVFEPAPETSVSTTALDSQDPPLEEAQPFEDLMRLAAAAVEPADTSFEPASDVTFHIPRVFSPKDTSWKIDVKFPEVDAISVSNGQLLVLTGDVAASDFRLHKVKGHLGFRDPELQRWLDAFDMQTREWTRPPPKEPPRTSAEKARPSSHGKQGGAKGNGGDVANQGLVGTINEGACKGRGIAVTKGRKGRGGRGQGKGGARATKGSGRGQSK
ncbi:hypothetical protein CYMTET_48328 [Cymbomonas tetramitiformis]|uniref:Uncharacterized protein n=1 Tax=Cymbomonas tetramitiformis TaxID=36881 RepID=A0AAE0BTR6_9CHLO|nr:hypothetical protein CYMTET_48328 [Cymbomonas tetramitiformis]